jgi:hypothetical protein
MAAISVAERGAGPVHRCVLDCGTAAKSCISPAGGMALEFFTAFGPACRATAALTRLSGRMEELQVP